MVVGDVADEAVQKETVDRALSEFGRLDFAVNNCRDLSMGRYNSRKPVLKIGKSNRY
jgi:NAD(P)-dependent dehydrogenase (short-subunit alcohol dehydrogenase family)